MKHQKTKKILVSAIAIALACLMALSLVISTLVYAASAARSDELKTKLDELQERADENDALQQQVQDQLDANYDQIRALVTQKQEIDQAISETQQQIAEMNTQIEGYNISIAQKQAELEAGEAEQGALYEKYKQRIRAMEETGSISYWSVLFESRSFSDLLDRIDMIGEIVTADQLMMEQMEEMTQRLENERAALETEKAALVAAKTALAELETQLESQREESDSYILQINSDIGMLNALNLEYESMGDDLQEQIDSVQTEYDAAKAAEEEARRKQQEAQNAANSSTLPGGGSAGSVNASGFLYPLPAGTSYVSCSYGYRYHPITGKYSFHYGVDLAANRGTSIYASKAGTVTVATYGSINGNYIKIQHADGSMTIYCHLDTFAVSAGDYVSQGQKIGTVGTTGSSTGYHLHFEIHINGSSVNPMDYVSVQ